MYIDSPTGASFHLNWLIQFQFSWLTKCCSITYLVVMLTSKIYKNEFEFRKVLIWCVWLGKTLQLYLNFEANHMIQIEHAISALVCNITIIAQNKVFQIGSCTSFLFDNLGYISFSFWKLKIHEFLNTSHIKYHKTISWFTYFYCSLIREKQIPYNSKEPVLALYIFTHGKLKCIAIHNNMAPKKPSLFFFATSIHVFVENTIHS